VLVEVTTSLSTAHREGRISKWKVAGGPCKSKRNKSGKKRLQKEEKQNK
jgi:hypothetical protein